MTSEDKRKGFSGLDFDVTDVEEWLNDVERRISRKKTPSIEARKYTEDREQQLAQDSSSQKPSSPTAPAPRSTPSETSNVWLWILGFVILATWIASLDSGSSRKSNTPVRVETPTVANSLPDARSLPAMTKPPVGTDHLHSIAEIRWCLAEDIRIEAIRPTANSSSDIDRFNRIVGNYNGRCSSFRYRDGALERATREIEAVRLQIVESAIQPGASREQRQPDPLIRSIQQELVVLGYSPGPADGLFGAKTRDAIKEYQREHGHLVTGSANAALMDQIRITKKSIASFAETSESFATSLDAQAWLTDMSRRLAAQVRDPEERLVILSRVHYEATRRDLPPELILAVIDVESGFDRYAIAVDGSRGLMQVMPYWTSEIGRPEDNLIYIDTNLRYGCTILKYYLDEENGDVGRALARYDGSVGRRDYPDAVLSKLKSKWFKS